MGSVPTGFLKNGQKKLKIDYNFINEVIRIGLQSEELCRSFLLHNNITTKKLICQPAQFFLRLMYFIFL